MKRTFLFMTCVLASVMMYAQEESNDYIPFVELGKKMYVMSVADNPNDVGSSERYETFIEEGKVWKVGPCDSGNPVQLVEYYYFDGDTIIDGKTCKQMMCQRFIGPDYSNEYWVPTPSLSKVGAWYEENKKVYFYDEIKRSMEMKYDFSLN